MIILVDGDVVAYRAACSPIRWFCDFEGVEKKREPNKAEAIRKLDELILEILEGASGKDILQNIEYEVFITGKGNFRNEYAVTAPYKGNRKDIEKPEFLSDCRQHLVDHYGAITSVDEEADDLLAIRATELGPENACIASTDKDMLQVNCWHYNITKQELKFVEEFEGLRWFYGQIIEGDRADNIIGINGIGPKKREKILAGCTTEGDLYQKCVDTFMTVVSDTPTQGHWELAKARVLENGRLAWLRRKPQQIWSPFEWTRSLNNGN